MLFASLRELVARARRWVCGTSALQAEAGQSAHELSDWRRGIESAGWIHMNAAGASPSHHLAHAAVVGLLDDERGRGGYAAAASERQNAREGLALLLSCHPDEIALVESAQAAWAKAFYSLRFGVGDRVGAQQIDAVVQGGILPTSVSRLWRGQPQGASPPDHADRRAAFP